MGVVSNNRFDRVLLSVLYMSHVQTLMLTDVQAPLLGTPLAPRKIPPGSHAVRSVPLHAAWHAVRTHTCLQGIKQANMPVSVKKTSRNNTL